MPTLLSSLVAKKKSQPTKIAYSYVRFSSLEQAKGDSLRRQTKEAANWARDNGYALKDLKFEDKGKSAYNSAHLEGGLGRFLQAIDAGVVKPGDSLLVESLDRLSRDEVLEALGLFSRILKKGVQIITYSDRRIYTQETASDLGTIMYSIMVMARAHEESQVKAERLKKTWENKRANLANKKLTSIMPYWLRLKGGQIEVVEERAAIVRSIFAKAIKGVGIDRITKELNAAGVPSWRPKKSGALNGWQKSYILKILRNRAVMGEFQPHVMARVRQPSGVFKKARLPEGEPVKGYYPRIVAPAIFEKAGRALTVRAFAGAGRKGEGRNLFAHVARCDCCKGPAVFINKGKWRYLACDNARRKVRCEYVSWTYEDFETSFLTWVKGLDAGKISGVDYDSLIQDEEIKKGGISANLEGEARKLDKLVDLLTSTDSVPTRLLEEMRKIETRVTELKSEIADVDRRIGELKDRQAGGTTLEPLKELDLSDSESRERARREIREKIDRIDIDFSGASAFTKCRPSFTVKFHKEYDREYVIVPNEHNPSDFHMLIEYANGEANAWEPDI